LSAEKFPFLKPKTAGAVVLGAAAVLWGCTSLAAPASAPAAAAPTAAAPAAPAAGASSAASTVDMAHAKATFESLCNGCHEAALATDARYDRKGWESVIERMYGFGLSATDAQAKEIVEYLSANYAAQ
jgi:cytochrome c5